MEGPATHSHLQEAAGGGHSSDKGLASWSRGWVSVHRKGHLWCGPTRVGLQKAPIEGFPSAIWSSVIDPEALKIQKRSAKPNDLS